MKSTFKLSDVKLLLTDVSNEIKPQKIEVREALIKAGNNAYDTIPYEDMPTDEELLFFEKALSISAIDTANLVKALAEKIYIQKNKEPVLVSLARGGIPAGILIKRYLDKKYKINVPHYAITLIGTKSIDYMAVEYVFKQYDTKRIQFIDGWTGKGAINRALKKSLEKYEGVNSELAVLSDPSNLLELCGTYEDVLIASACLNSPLVGLISRAIPLENSFFGAIFFDEFLDCDKTYSFIDTIESKFDYGETNFETHKNELNGLEEVQNIARDFDIDDIHFIKPGLGETMRALIRKKPDFILVNNKKDKYIEFIREVAEDKGIVIKEYPLKCYKVCSIYRDCNSDIL